MEYLVLSEDCLDDFTINEDMTVVSDDCDELDAVVIPLQYIEQITIDEDDEIQYEFLIRLTIPTKELQRLMLYADKSSADESWFHLTFNWKYIAFK